VKPITFKQLVTLGWLMTQVLLGLLLLVKST